MRSDQANKTQIRQQNKITKFNKNLWAQTQILCVKCVLRRQFFEAQRKIKSYDDKLSNS